MSLRWFVDQGGMVWHTSTFTSAAPAMCLRTGVSKQKGVSIHRACAPRLLYRPLPFVITRICRQGSNQRMLNVKSQSASGLLLNRGVHEM